MWKFAVLLTCLSGYCLAGPVGPKRNMPIVQQRYEDAASAEMTPAENVDPHEMLIMSSLSLPSNATSIRADITDGFSCENKTYGYYADVDNDCQIFHVCLPVTYADGKENTFRWSFICPEETIFSQDSFTCMRPDDMTSTCEESYQYYELNRKFGIVEPAAEKENNNNNNEAVSETAESNVVLPVAQVEPLTAKPVVHDEEENVVEQAKPVSAPKPSRRKPAIVYAIQKKPANSYPLRKIPQIQVQAQMPDTSAIPISEDVNAIKPVEEQQIKPAAFNFSRRPVTVLSNSFKDKIQNTKAESVLLPTRNELFNQVRKRPTSFEKKPAEQPEEEKQVEQSKIDSEKKQHNFSPLVSDMSISNSKPQVADAEIEASESNHVFVKPEEEKVQIAAEEPVQAVEAFEEIPAVISEVVETPNAEEELIKNEETLKLSNEKPNFADEPQITEETQSAEEVQTDDELHIRKETQTFQENADEIQTVVEAQAVEQPQDVKSTLTADEPKTSEEAQASEEAAQAPQNLKTSAEEVQNIEGTQSDEKLEEPAAQTQNTEEVQIAVENRVPEATQVDEESQKSEEIPEEPQPDIESQGAAEAHIEEKKETDEKVPAIEENEMDRETKVEEEVSEAQQSLRTSAEENQNAEETVVAEANPIAEAAEAAPAAEQTEAANQFDLAENAQSTVDTQELQAVPLSEEVQAQVQAETTNAEEVQNNANSQEHEEPISEIHAQASEQLMQAEDALTVEEPQPVVHEIEEPIEDSKPAEEIAAAEPVSANNDADLVNSEISNSAEETDAAAVQTVEQMESEKPAEAPESMPATEEMSHPDAMVQQMYENMDASKQSIGGFKPVDPVMAHEAEQLIVDFINTLRKNDFTNETPGMHIEHQIDEVVEEEQPEKSAEVQENEKVDSNEEAQENTSKLLEQEDKDEAQAEISDSPADTMEDNKEAHEIEEPNVMAAETNEINVLKSLEVEESLEDARESQKSEENLTDTMNLPQEMYQIPVQVIAAPVEEMPMKEEQSHDESKMEAAEVTDNTEEQITEASLDMPMAGHKPLSIDDIVELVKERLDHMPKDEMENPMQLEQVLGEAQEDKVAVDKVEEQPPFQEAAQEHSSQSEEEIVMPIYQRTVQPAQIDAGVQTENLEQAVDEEQPEASSDAVSDVQEKTNRSYRSRSVQTPKVDSRKRHFLFKTESS